MSDGTKAISELTHKISKVMVGYRADDGMSALVFVLLRMAQKMGYSLEEVHKAIDGASDFMGETQNEGDWS